MGPSGVVISIVREDLLNKARWVATVDYFQMESIWDIHNVQIQH